MTIYAFACSIKGEPNEPTIINSTRAGLAKTTFYRDVVDALPVRFIDIRVRKIGGPHTSKAFARTAAYRGMPGLKCGQAVKAVGCAGFVVGHNESANFNVLFNEGRLAGGTYNVHPSELTLVTEIGNIAP